MAIYPLISSKSCGGFCNKQTSSVLKFSHLQFRFHWIVISVFLVQLMSVIYKCNSSQLVKADSDWWFNWCHICRVLSHWSWINKKYLRNFLFFKYVTNFPMECYRISTTRQIITWRIPSWGKHYSYTQKSDNFLQWTLSTKGCNTFLEKTVPWLHTLKSGFDTINQIVHIYSKAVMLFLTWLLELLLYGNSKAFSNIFVKCFSVLQCCKIRFRPWFTYQVWYKRNSICHNHQVQII